MTFANGYYKTGEISEAIVVDMDDGPEAQAREHFWTDILDVNDTCIMKEEELRL